MKALNWLTYSSANPQKLSLTIKAGLPFVIFLAAYLKLDIGMADWDKLIEAAVSVISGLFFIYGFGRKIVNSFKR